MFYSSQPLSLFTSLVRFIPEGFQLLLLLFVGGCVILKGIFLHFLSDDISLLV